MVRRLLFSKLFAFITKESCDDAEKFKLNLTMPEM